MGGGQAADPAERGTPLIHVQGEVACPPEWDETERRYSPLSDVWPQLVSSGSGAPGMWLPSMLSHCYRCIVPEGGIFDFRVDPGLQYLLSGNQSMLPGPPLLARRGGQPCTTFPVQGINRVLGSGRSSGGYPGAEELPFGGRPPRLEVEASPCLGRV
jgi:hypothetical protein